MSNKINGYVYLIHPVLIEKDIYKIGMSMKHNMDRIKSYGKNTEIIRVLYCNDPKLVEDKLKLVFNEKFELIKGNEYFKGDKNIMATEFDNITNEFKLENTHNDEISKNKTYECWKCGNNFCRQDVLNKHLEKLPPCVSDKIINKYNDKNEYKYIVDNISKIFLNEMNKLKSEILLNNMMIFNKFSEIENNYNNILINMNNILINMDNNLINMDNNLKKNS